MKQLIPHIWATTKGHDAELDDPIYRTLDTTLNHFKVFAHDTVKIALNAQNNYSHVIEIKHNLGYVPYAYARMNAKFVKNGSRVAMKPEIFSQLPVFTQPFFDGDPTTYAFIYGSYERDNNVYRIKVEESNKTIGAPTYFDIDNILLTYFIFEDKQLLV